MWNSQYKTFVCCYVFSFLYTKIKTLSHEYNFVIPSFGICPWRADRYSSNLISLDKYLDEGKYIGEIGLYKRFFKICGILIDQVKVFEYIISHDSINGKLLNLYTSGVEMGSFEISRKIVSAKDLLRRLLFYWWWDCFNEYIREITRVIPLDRILIEADNPSSYSWLLRVECNNGMPALLI